MNSTSFKIVVPTYNAERWIGKCLLSIMSQTHKNFQCVAINDCSTDSTGLVMDDVAKKIGDERLTIIHNTSNRKTLRNLIDGYRMLGSDSDPESVLVVVDGDDSLFSEYSLEIVDSVYRNSNAKLTYGSFVHWPTGEISSFSRVFPKNVVCNNAYRDHPFISSHLRTYKSYLWNSIRDEDLRDIDGDYFKVACDVATMIPMLEMAGSNFVHIPNILYVYNRWNPLSDDVINSSEQSRIDRLIREKNKYSPL